MLHFWLSDVLDKAVDNRAICMLVFSLKPLIKQSTQKIVFTAERQEYVIQ